MDSHHDREVARRKLEREKRARWLERTRGASDGAAVGIGGGIYPNATEAEVDGYLAQESPEESPSEAARAELERNQAVKWRAGGVPDLSERHLEELDRSDKRVEGAEVPEVEDVEVGATTETARAFADTRRNVPESPQGIRGVIRRWLGR